MMSKQFLKERHLNFFYDHKIFTNRDAFNHFIQIIYNVLLCHLTVWGTVFK